MKKYSSFTVKNFKKIPQIANLPREVLDNIEIVSMVLPFRVNNYVTEELIDWNNLPEDPIFQLTFPQPGMLSNEHFDRLAKFHRSGLSKKECLPVVREIQHIFNPHPAGQMNLNVPVSGGEKLKGMQHKYSETALFFPSQGQTCHAYCTYCFRWAQFVGLNSLKFASHHPEAVVTYLNQHPKVTDILFTGGDPMVMRTNRIKAYIDPLLRERPGGLSTIRFGTKSLAYWPYRFLTDSDADELLRLFDNIIAHKIHLSIMAHFSHYRELETNAAQKAIKRLRDTGAVIRCQAPLIRHVNDTPHIWEKLWQAQVNLGMIPYYMFVERDTGAKKYFEVPLYEAFRIFTEAYSRISGLCRTVRGPSMSATPGKILIDGITTINDEKVFSLKFIQGRNPKWVNQMFFAKYDENVCWINDLEPAFGAQEFFYEKELKCMMNSNEQVQ